MPITQEQIDKAKLSLRKQFEARRAEEKQQFHAEAEQAYEAAQRRERDRWIAEWKLDNAPRPMQYPYSNYSDAELYRVSLPPEERIDKLLEAGFLDEALRVWLYRRKSRAPLSEVKAFLKDYIPTDGEEEFFSERITEGTELTTVGRALTTHRTDHVVTCSGLSQELKNVLHSLTVQNDVVYFVTKTKYLDKPGLLQERWLLAHQDEDYSADEY